MILLLDKIDQFHKWLNEQEFYIGLRQNDDVDASKLCLAKTIRKKFEEMFEIE